MIITNCPRCGSMNATTTCTKCGWSQFTKSTVSTGVLLDDYKRLLLENRNLKERVAELEAGNTALKQHPQPIEFWSDEKKELYRRNESRTIKSGREEEREE